MPELFRKESRDMGLELDPEILGQNPVFCA